MTISCAYIPKPPLAAFVDKIWLYDGYELPHLKERRLPDGSMELVINLHEDTIRIYDRQNHEQFQCFTGSVISGAHTECFVIDTASQTSIIGVHFNPGSAFPFLTLPAGELHNAHISIDMLWGPTANDLRNQLLEAGSTDTKFHILEQFLLTHTAHPLVRHPAITFALKEFQSVPNTRTIAEVTEQIGLSPRRFIQIFREEVGLTPKQFCRVRRFQETLCLINRGEQIEWTDIALTCGYFDQSHFNHDFRVFSGLNPSTYLMYRGEHRNHVPLYE